MKYTQKSIPTFRATINIGLQVGYTSQKLSKADIIDYIQSYQRQLIHKSKIYLSASVTDCDIVLDEQIEPHLKLEFINYPRFPLSINVLKSKVTELAGNLMSYFHQNRIAIVFSDETLMLEGDSNIDPRISLVD